MNWSVNLSTTRSSCSSWREPSWRELSRQGAAGAFRPYNSWTDVYRVQKPSKEVHEILHYKGKSLDVPILPLCRMDGVIDETETTSLASYVPIELGRRTGLRENMTFYSFSGEAPWEVDSEL